MAKQERRTIGYDADVEVPVRYVAMTDITRTVKLTTEDVRYAYEEQGMHDLLPQLKKTEQSELVGIA